MISDLPPLGPVEPELLSLFHPRALAARAARIAELLHLREQWQQTGVMPVAVEIGAHRAAHLVGMAREHAPAPVLGIEVREKYVRLARERLRKHQVENALMLHADAQLAIPILLDPSTVKAFHVTFPDPWWKERHADRRVLHPVIMRVLARRLVARGRLYLKSDVFEYLHRVRLMAQASRALRPLPAERWPDERHWTWTVRERKCMNSAIPFGRGYYERRDDFPATLPDEPEQRADFPFDEEADPARIIRGAPPQDIEARRRRLGQSPAPGEPGPGTGTS
ncbi:MAG: hypothetical protein EA398_05895 [Deltaproteobacteria bacterium]|nr:MAG: hypothetical protein EA398_05895 [Deltaproteobacteria bacterium]